MVKKNTWVRIHKIVLTNQERANNLPAETKKVNLEMWVKGFLINDANIGDEVEIQTLTKRIETGRLVEVNPSFKHNYGEFVPEILEISKIVKRELYD